mgnify:CR=1 FL=1
MRYNSFWLNIVDITSIIVVFFMCKNDDERHALQCVWFREHMVGENMYQILQ